MFDPPNQTPGNIQFRLFGIPIQIHPLFWLIAFIFSPFLQMSTENMPMWLLGLAGWMCAWLAIFIIHEMGHALVISRRYGASPWIVLYGLGGLTGHNPYYKRRPETAGRILISFAGPAAGFLAVGAILLFFTLIGIPINLDFKLLGSIPLPLPETAILWVSANSSPSTYFAGWFIFSFIWMGIFWGLLNLIPIQPLDGGNIVFEILTKIAPWRGAVIAAMISIVLSIVLAGLFIMTGTGYAAIFFLYLAWNNYEKIRRPTYR